METCTVEVGLLKKKPCGEPSVTRCDNCEQPLCGKHSVPQTNETGRKTGKFLCKECAVAQREHEKAVGYTPAEKPKPAPAQQAKIPAGPANAPAPAPKPPAAPAPKPENSDGSIEFTPTKK